MTTDITSAGEEDSEKREIKITNNGGSGTVYALGLIGAWVYYIGRANTNQERVMGFLKGLVWPAFMVYDLLQFLHRE